VSTFILAKLWWGIFLIVAAGLYGFWQGAKEGWRRGFHDEANGNGSNHDQTDNESPK
jgi:hypothetical protein